MVIVREVHQPKHETRLEMAHLLHACFPWKGMHFGLGKMESIDLHYNLLRDQMLSPNHVFALAYDDDYENLLGICSLYTRPFVEPPIYAHMEKFRKNQPWLKRLRIGKLYVVLNPPKLQENQAYLKTLAVVPEARGQGVGGRLLDWADDVAKHNVCASISLHVATDNPALKLYKRKGYMRDPKLDVCDFFSSFVCRLCSGVPGYNGMTKSLSQ